jgi:hypothetical protein
MHRGGRLSLSVAMNQKTTACPMQRTSWPARRPRMPLRRIAPIVLYLCACGPETLTVPPLVPVYEVKWTSSGKFSDVRDIATDAYNDLVLVGVTHGPDADPLGEVKLFRMSTDTE